MRSSELCRWKIARCTISSATPRCWIGFFVACICTLSKHSQYGSAARWKYFSRSLKRNQIGFSIISYINEHRRHWCCHIYYTKRLRLVSMLLLREREKLFIRLDDDLINLCVRCETSVRSFIIRADVKIASGGWEGRFGGEFVGKSSRFMWFVCALFEK